jgi:hypothetical protein
MIRVMTIEEFEKMSAMVEQVYRAPMLGDQVTAIRTAYAMALGVKPEAINANITPADALAIVTQCLKLQRESIKAALSRPVDEPEPPAAPLMPAGPRPPVVPDADLPEDIRKLVGFALSLGEPDAAERIKAEFRTRRVLGHLPDGAAAAA